MIELKPFETEDIPAIMSMETASDTSDYIIEYDDTKHHDNLANSAIVYLKICRDGKIAGFFILALEDNNHSVEFRRIVVGDKGKGTGQQAIALMEDYCARQLNRKRIWLDVFAHNQRGRHIYEKLGYQEFDRYELNGSVLILLEKPLP